jgi:MerR family transcriptional regulator/heat shock protein HspR
MKRNYWTIVEIIETFEVEEKFLIELEEEDILHPLVNEKQKEKRYDPDEVEKLRLAKILVEEMDVNLPGVEIILHMRRNMLEMRRQFDAILEDLAKKLKRDLP